MSRVYVEIDGIRVEVVKLGRGVLGRHVQLEVTVPNAKEPIRTVKMYEGDVLHVKASHETVMGK